MQTTNALVRGYRLLRIALHILIGMAIVAMIWSFAGQPKKLQHIKWWSRRLLACFNVRIATFGDLPKDGLNNVMFIANHVSWIDIHALNSITPLQFIAKSDINHWPILGYLARKSGTLFINRSSRKDASRIVERAVLSLKSGRNIGFFPEGTTTDGTQLKPFKSSIVQAAIDADAQIYPVAIRYPTPNGGINTQMAYTGDISMGESIMNMLKQKNPIVELHFLIPIEKESLSRQALTQIAYERISHALGY